MRYTPRGGETSPASKRSSDYADLRLVDQDGRPFTLRSIGAPVALSFIATRLTETWASTEALFLRLDREIARRNLDARLVLLTLDPSYDRPVVLAQTALALVARAPRLRLATGGNAGLDRLLHAFHVEVRFDAAGAPQTHDTFTYILDERARPRRAIPLSSRSAEAILAELAAPRPAA